MQLQILDENFNILAPVPVFKSLIWIRRYKKIGAFELYTTPEYFHLFNQGEYLYRNDAEELGVIKEVNYKQEDNGEMQAYAKGYFAERILMDRVIDKTMMLSGTTEDAMRTLVNTFAVNPENEDRKIEHLKLGQINNLGSEISSQITGGSLSDELYTLGNADNLSHRVRYDYLTNDLSFEVWRGKDRRSTQTENSWAVFSDSFCNILGTGYTKNKEDYRNVAYVAGEENEDGSREIVVVDARESDSEKRRELYVDARDLQSATEDGNKLSTEEYHALLTQRGIEKLAEYQVVETVDSDVDPTANLVYKKDFDLGDFCEYINTKIGVMMEQILTEITETYEGGTMKLDIKLGNDGVTTVKQLIKREA